MKLADELRAEHELIERVLRALYAFARAPERPGRDAAGFLAFFRRFAGAWHHGREEEVLFTALVEHAELKAGSGPVRSLHGQHRAMERILEEEIAPGFAPESVLRYAYALLAHIDAENSVLIPESVERLRKAGVRELESREMDAKERAARIEGERLADAYGEGEIPGAIRGEGCVICTSYGVSCEGLEREWWSQAEWDAFDDFQG